LADESRGVQFTLNGGWLSKVIAVLAASWIIWISGAMVQVMLTRFTNEDAHAIRLDAAEIRGTLRGHVAIPGHPVMEERVRGIADEVGDVKRDTERILERLNETRK
jgi:hypothetical protein